MLVLIAVGSKAIRKCGLWPGVSYSCLLVLSPCTRKACAIKQEYIMILLLLFSTMMGLLVLSSHLPSTEFGLWFACLCVWVHPPSISIMAHGLADFYRNVDFFSSAVWRLSHFPASTFKMFSLPARDKHSNSLNLFTLALLFTDPGSSL